MAQIEIRLSSKEDKQSHRCEILIRFFNGTQFDAYGKSGIFILPSHFRYYVNRAACEKAGVRVPAKTTSVTMKEAEAKGYSIRKSGEIVISEKIDTEDVKHDKEADAKLKALKMAITSAYESDKEAVKNDKNWLSTFIDKFHHPEKYMSQAEQDKQKSIYELAEVYLNQKQFSYDHVKGFRAMVRGMARYECFVRETDKSRTTFQWNIDEIDRDDIEDFFDYLRNEVQLQSEYPEIFKKLLKDYPVEIGLKHKSPKLVVSGENTIIKKKKRLKAFFKWLNETKRTSNRPFEGIMIGSEKYGVPFYLTIDERNAVADADLSADKQLEIQRDIFIFQCFVGCRVGDLVKLRPENITDGILEYIPRKTKDEDEPVKPRVPLSIRAKQLVEKYKGIDADGRLFPFISPQKYNDAIKAILEKCEITRNVQVRNSKTGEIETRRICDVASSHIARRTFVGAAYKKVRDPNIIGKMSGHVEGSRAFSRYRDIDDSILSETISAIE